MATTTQFNPNADLNAQLLAAGASKTVYALVTPETEGVKNEVFGGTNSWERDAYLSQFRDAWTGKQDRYHEEFFDVWHEWSKPVVDLDRTEFPFFYPTAGASEPLRHIIFDHAAKGGKSIHVFEGEYEGYKAMAEAAGLEVIEHKRHDDDADALLLRHGSSPSVTHYEMDRRSLFFISQPSAIDGNVWPLFNEFISKMPKNSVVVDLTYVGAVAHTAVPARFNMNQPAVRNVVFSLSKPFGCYYDRIGGVFCRQEDLGLFGNRWFKGLTGLNIGTALMKRYDVFHFPTRYEPIQIEALIQAGNKLGLDFLPSDVFILTTAIRLDTIMPVGEYLKRAGKIRACLTPGMARLIGESHHLGSI